MPGYLPLGHYVVVVTKDGDAVSGLVRFNSLGWYQIDDNWVFYLDIDEWDYV